jgi:hypothetical protein
MKLSTQLSHLKIRIKHGFLKLRVQQPLYYKTLAALVLIFAVGGVLAAYYFHIMKTAPTTMGDQTQLEIQSYSLNGEVTAVNGSIIEVKAAVVTRVNGVNNVEYAQKKILITDSTSFRKIQIKDGKVTAGTAGLPDIKPGNKIAVYTTANPETGAELPAERVEIIQ